MWSDALLTAGLILVIVAGAVAAYLEWQKRTPAERADMVEEAVRRLVEAAEQLYPQSGAGQTKYGWVMNRLQKRFPGVEWETLGEYVEQAVLHLNASRKARHGAPLNGRHDA